MFNKRDHMLILGGGLTGLSAGYCLSATGAPVDLFEADSAVGGISKTIEHRGYRFDLGGHRFFTKDKKINAFVKDLMGDELITVRRKSKILLNGKYFDYPLKPMNALFGMGIPSTLRILGDYGRERLKRYFRSPAPVSLEDWVVAHFGRAMYDMYFREYSEKVWGIACDRISAGWVAQRIRGLSLSTAIADAFFRARVKDIPSLVDEFDYPRSGIGRIAERLGEEVARFGKVHLNARVEKIHHSGFRIDAVTVRTGDRVRRVPGAEIISTIPVTHLVTMLDPAPPEAILAAAASLRFRDIVIVAVMIDKRPVTDQTWIYIPEKKIPFGRIHEPTNWSGEMAPRGKTLLVAEFFCFRGDEVWTASDQRLISTVTNNLEHLGYISRDQVNDGCVVRAPKAYPLFEVGYENHVSAIADYLARFENLHTAGRIGMFRYYNMDHAIASGLLAAERVMKKRSFTPEHSMQEVPS